MKWNFKIFIYEISMAEKVVLFFSLTENIKKETSKEIVRTFSVTF